MRFNRLAAAVLNLLLLASCAAPVGTAGSAPAQAGTVKIADHVKLGKILATPNGLALYTLSADAPNVSNCNDSCAQSWPPFTLASGEPVAPAGLSGQLGIALRKDNSRQLTYSSRPLYLFAGDKAAGDATGEGINSFGGVWSVVKAGVGVAPAGGATPTGAGPSPAPTGGYDYYGY